MSQPEQAAPPEANRRRPRTMAFRKRSRIPLPTREQAKRQSDVIQWAWRHFGEAAPVIAFLNTRQDALDGQPLYLAIESDEELERVESLLDEMALRA